MDLLTELEHLELASMFLLGLLGSGHCVGMCGPLILAFPARREHPLAHVLYNAGRIVTYTIIGAILAGAGAGVAVTIALSSLDLLRPASSVPFPGRMASRNSF